MLTPEYLEHCPDDIVVLYSELDQLIMRDVVRRIMKTGHITSTAAWQVLRAQESGLIYDEIIAEAALYTNASEQQVQALFKDAGLKAVAYDSAIYTAAGLSPPPLAMVPAALQVLNAGLQKTQGYLQNLTKTTANGAQQAYIHAATIAEMQVESGAFDYVSAIRNAVRTAIDGGEWVTYPSGHHDRLDVATRRAVLTGINQTSAEVSLSYADDMECDLVETTAHAGARPSHMVWQGQVFSRSGKSDKYDDFAGATGYGTGAGLCGWHCRHSFHPFFEGLSESAYPKSKLKEYENQIVTYNGEKISYYDATQQQRAMERAIRDSKRKAAGFDEAVKSAKDEPTAKAMKQEFDAAAVRLKKQEAALKDFTQQTGLLRQREREQVVATKTAGKTVSFGRSPAQKAVQAANKQYQQWIHDVGASDAAPKTLAKYYQEKYNNSPAYQLLKGYSHAVDKGDIHPLVGLAQYQKSAAEIGEKIVGVTTSTGVTIESFATHFIDRIIGQTSTPHTDMRCGVTVDAAADALKNPVKLGSVRTLDNGDIRQTLYGKHATVTISICDKRLIQTNPR
ncbi:phage minor capsid protein [Caproicibacterium amylolyticum]|uniref:Phage minor capsid protein n=1 Tax=Caproicibacterium amylolyticum TaxID=2766537 RepID=A0A7G9WF86_9FIRM|nr:phage minor capsid protein [Caproicibacterium amylolyticum]QNO17348.1 phage minor capsid protein [Caproicibacterium amylolyticum]